LQGKCGEGEKSGIERGMERRRDRAKERKRADESPGKEV
jgi:hypothetical protein